MRMVRSIISFMFVAALLLGTFVNTNKAAAAGAYTANWTSVVAYHNVGAAEANLTISFYSDSNGTATVADFPLSALPMNAGRTLMVADVSGVTAGFKGGAVINSDQPVTSAVIQYSPDAGFKLRLLYTGFDVSSASDQVLIATVLKNKFERTTVFSIQNTETVAADVTVKFVNGDAPNVGQTTSTQTYNIPAQSVKYIDMGNNTTTGITASIWNGSAVISAVKSDQSPALVVAAANEYYSVNKNLAASFEGIPLAKTGNTVYMATALCNSFNLKTAYAVQNASETQNAVVTVQYKNANGTNGATDGPFNLTPGAKASILTCNKAASGFSGAAVISSTGGEIAVIGKASSQVSTGTVFTAFLGEIEGSNLQSVPYVRWTNQSTFDNTNLVGAEQRTTLAIQNVTPSNQAINVRVRYFDKDGVLKGTHLVTINAGSKQNSQPVLANALDTSGKFGYYSDGSSGGAAIIDLNPAATNPSDAQFIAVVRAAHNKASYSEDFNSVDIVSQ